MKPFWIFGLIFLPRDLFPIILCSFLILYLWQYVGPLMAHFLMALSSVPFFINLIKEQDFKLLLYELLYLFLSFYVAMIFFVNVFVMLTIFSLVFLIEKDIRCKTVVFWIKDNFPSLGIF